MAFKRIIHVMRTKSWKSGIFLSFFGCIWILLFLFYEPDIKVPAGSMSSEIVSALNACENGVYKNLYDFFIK